MKWVTREHPRTDRIACPWLIRKFIDPEAEIVYVVREDVLPYAEREGAMSFDAPGARYTHRGGLCSFEVLIEDHDLRADPALALMARVIHGADVSEDPDATPQSAGLLAIADGFALGGRSNPDYYALMAKRLANVFPDFTVEVFPDRHHFDPPHRIEPARVAASLRSLWARAQQG